MGLKSATQLIVALALGLSVTLSRGAVFTDSMGRKVSVEGAPERIVTLAPSLTEIVYFLGLGDRVVGVTEFSSFPPDADLKPKVGSYVNLNAEKIVSLAPDLVIGTADGNQPRVVELLEKAGIPAFIVNPRDLRQVIETVVDIGRVCGVPDKALALAEELSARVDRIVSRIAGRERPVVFLQVNSKPIMTVNGDTYSSDLIRLAGGVNMAADEPISYPRISLEAVIQRRPEVIIVSSMGRGEDFERVKRQWQALPVIPAARNGRVHLVDSDLIDRPSPRIVEGLEILGRLIHPDAAWDE